MVNFRNVALDSRFRAGINAPMGRIRDYFETEAPEAVRAAIREAEGRDILDSSYPYNKRMAKDDYQEELAALQVELVKLQ